MITRRTTLGGLIAAPLLGSRVLAAPGAPSEFRIGYQKSGILTVVRQQGTIEAALKPLGVETVKWLEFQFGPPIMEALAVGSVDLGAAGDTPPIFAQAAGSKVVYAAATPAQESAILVPRASPIRTVAELKGKKIAFARGSSSHNFLVQALVKAGLGYKDVEPAFLSPADAAAAFVRGSVDAWVVWDPYYALAETRHDARVVTTTQGILDSNSFYLANRDFAGRNGAVLKAALDGIARTTAWAADRRPELAKMVADATGMDIAAQQRTVERLSIEFLPIDDRIVAAQQSIADTFHGLNIIPRAITVRDAVWTPSQS